VSKHVTGCFLRVYRNGKWGNADIATLLDSELRDYFQRMRDAAVPGEMPGLTGEDFAVFLAGWIRDHVVVTDSPNSVTSKEDDDA
jgi:hypothetical protein